MLACGCRWLFLRFAENIRTFSSIFSIAVLLMRGRRVVGMAKVLVAGGALFY